MARGAEQLDDLCAALDLLFHRGPNGLGPVALDVWGSFRRHPAHPTGRDGAAGRDEARSFDHAGINGIGEPRVDVEERARTDPRRVTALERLHGVALRPYGLFRLGRFRGRMRNAVGRVKMPNHHTRHQCAATQVNYPVVVSC